MSNMEHLFENAIDALHHNKTYDEWVISEVGKNIKAIQGESKAVTFDNDNTIIDLYDIWVLANYVDYMFTTNLRMVLKWLDGNKEE